MNLLKRIKFVIKHDIEPGYIVIPFGSDGLDTMRFMRYEDALEFVEQEVAKKPQFGRPAILVKLQWLAANRLKRSNHEQ